MPQLDAIDTEYDAWLALCQLLRETQAVTEDDLQSPALAAPATPGTALIHAVKIWAAARTQLVLQHPAVQTLEDARRVAAEIVWL